MFGVIYKATNKIDGKIYIGQTTQPLYIRIKKHFCKNDGSYFHNALIKYGKVAFRWEIIDIAESIDDLNQREAMAISRYGSMNIDIGYNLTTGGNSYKKSEESCRKQSERMRGKKLSPETIEKLRISHMGKPGYWAGRRPPSYEAWMAGSRTRESIEKSRNSKLGRIPWNKGKSGYTSVPCSVEKKEKLSRATKNQWANKTRKVICLDNGKIYSSAHSADKECGVKNVAYVCQGIYTHCGGTHWQYLDDYEKEHECQELL